MPQSDATSWSLVLGAAAALPSERARFCERYEPIVRSYLAARWLLPPTHERVMDACQEVFVKLLEPGGPLERMQTERPEGFRAYLRGVTRFVANGIDRGDRRRRERETRYAQTPQPSEASLSRVFDQAWVDMLVTEAWQMMRDRARNDQWAQLRLDVLTMYYVDDLESAEILERVPSLDLRKFYRMLASGREQFRRSLMAVLASYHPQLSYAELDRRCREQLELL